ncbi:HIT-like domain-containing protein [Glomus cerebriforme]|uniref:HIT-like domain-containing protein n=1 Tax=Glomus cerebriforme TaxID=658196 RepID=A0A397SU43_9GLOM|nr:HIT-like domain-containing protein [Glomus cerebriforme]
MQTHFENKVTETYDRALRRGELYFVKSTIVNVTENDIEFEIRFAPSLAKRPTAEQTDENHMKHKVDPFAPYNQDLFVQEYGNHIVLLNKFCVVPNHLLVVTKEFEEQTDSLNQEDLAALWYCMMQFKNQQIIAFYNCGNHSGSSQPHKHMQVVPLPSDDRFTPPINAIIYKYQNKKPGEIFNFQELPYFHYVTLLDPQQLCGHHGHSHKETVSQYLTENYLALIDAMVEGMRASPLTEGFHPLSYNFLITHTWMMVVPRLSEKYEQISVNSLGFAGMLLVKNEEELDFVKNVGILRILEGVAISKDKDQLIGGVHISV